MTTPAQALAPVELAEADLPRLQAFMEANPAYWLAITGRPPRPEEAVEAWKDLPPADAGWTRRWFLGLHDGAGRLKGLAIVVSDLFAPRVWQLGTYLLASDLHGTGVAAPTLAVLEDRMRAEGARWLRMRVVVGNTRAERFWARHGLRRLRLHEGVDTDGKLNDVCVWAKALHQGDDPDLAEYLAALPQDLPKA